MKRTWIMLTLLTIAIAAGAQTEKRIYTKAEQESAKNEPPTLSKEARKQLEALQDSINFELAVAALENLDFVLEADKVTFKRGEMVFVTASTNFISLSDDEAVVQVAPVMSGGGPNGVGGITLEGRASNIILKTDKKGNVTFTMNVSGNALSATINLSMAKGSNRATVTVNPNLHSNRVTLSGYLLPSEASSVFKGRAF